MIRFAYKEKPVETERPVKERPSVFWEIVTALSLAAVRHYQQNAMELVRIEAISQYVKALGKARKAAVGYVGLSCLLLLLASGFVLFHVALLFLIPWAMWVKSLILLILSAVYLAVGVGVLLYATSERTWMKYSKASGMVAGVIERCRH